LLSAPSGDEPATTTLTTGSVSHKALLEFLEKFIADLPLVGVPVHRDSSGLLQIGVLAITPL
jgi:hypothetical protein